MKIKKIYLIALISLAVTVFISCAGTQSAKQENLMEPTVTLISCLPSFAGPDNICIEPIFIVENPNSSMVSFEIDYQLEADGQMIGKSMVSRLYIAPNESVEIKDSIVLSFKGLFVGEALSGTSKKETIMLMAPIWRGLGGVKPSMLPDNLWAKIPEKELMVTCNGSMAVSSGVTQKMILFERELTD